MKRSKILMLAGLIFCVNILSAQNTYYVLHTKGNVKLKKNGAVIKPNDQISEKEVLIFSSLSDAVAVISTKNGRLILKPKSGAKSTELVCIVSEIISPGTGRLSTRSGKLNNIIETKNFFGSDTLYVLGNMKVWISPTAFPMNNDNFFFVRYTWKGETINKKLSFSKDTLLLTPDDIFRIDGKHISVSEAQSMRLFYKKGAAANEICPFNVAFPDQQKLKESVGMMKKISDTNKWKKEDFISEVAAYMKDAYGKTDKDNLEEWIRKNIH